MSLFEPERQQLRGRTVFVDIYDTMDVEAVMSIRVPMLKHDKLRAKRAEERWSVTPT